MSLVGWDCISMCVNRDDDGVLKGVHPRCIGGCSLEEACGSCGGE